MNTHYVDIVDDNDIVLKSVPWEEMHKNALLHRVANVLVFNSKGELFVHKRSRNLPLHPSVYDAKFGGIADSGESYDSCAVRELEEEAGISGAKLQYLFDYKYRSKDVNTNAKVYRCIYDGKLKLQESEIEHGRFMTLAEITEMIKKGEMTPSVKIVMDKLKAISQ
ncbi:NUDIX domain-containing protein [Candidatus Woesearchaeota archaeon]|nr:NUDIX domain-containing protein [Candidatus Woesearchaeota archaeon]